MNIKRLNRLGEASYAALGSCVDGALQEEESEHAVICGVALLKLATTEQANYFGTRGYYNYNTAFELGKRAVKLAEKKGIPAFLEDEKNEMKRIIKDAGFD